MLLERDCLYRGGESRCDHLLLRLRTDRIVSETGRWCGEASVVISGVKESPLETWSAQLGSSQEGTIRGACSDLDWHHSPQAKASHG